MNDAVTAGAWPAARSSRGARDRYVRARRGSRPVLDPLQLQGVLVERERAADGGLASTATIFLTGRECAWRCVMCDLWRHTTQADTPRGAIAHQINTAVVGLRQLAAMPSVIKLYNAGSFFDPRAVPPSDDIAIVAAVQPFARVVVESHPALVGDRTWRLHEQLTRSHHDMRLEVAMGLETAHPSSLEQLNKGITVDAFAATARALSAHDVDLRVFLLIDPPFVPASEQAAWLARSVAAALDCGATAITLIPTRSGNGAMEALAAEGLFTPPSLLAIEQAVTAAMAHADRGRSRIFVDTWDLDSFATCPCCSDARQARLTEANLSQCVPPPLTCDVCGQVTPS